MICNNCGKEIPDGSMACPFCGRSFVVQQQAPAPVNIPTHMTESILVTLFCCLPFGIAAIVQASKVSGYIAGGNIPAAQTASNEASKYVKIGFFTGLVLNILIFAINFLAALD